MGTCVVSDGAGGFDGVKQKLMDFAFRFLEVEVLHNPLEQPITAQPVRATICRWKGHLGG